jgi:hypothetical protein
MGQGESTCTAPPRPPRAAAQPPAPRAQRVARVRNTAPRGWAGRRPSSPSTSPPPPPTRVGTFHVILQSKHHLMTPSIVHVTNLIPGSDNPTDDTNARSSSTLLFCAFAFAFEVAFATADAAMAFRPAPPAPGGSPHALTAAHPVGRIPATGRTECCAICASLARVTCCLGTAKTRDTAVHEDVSTPAGATPRCSGRTS